MERLAGRSGGGTPGGEKCKRGMAHLSNRSSRGISAGSDLSLISWSGTTQLTRQLVATAPVVWEMGGNLGSCFIRCSQLPGEGDRLAVPCCWISTQTRNPYGHNKAVNILISERTACMENTEVI